MVMVVPDREAPVARHRRLQFWEDQSAARARLDEEVVEVEVVEPKRSRSFDKRPALGRRQNDSVPTPRYTI